MEYKKFIEEAYNSLKNLEYANDEINLWRSRYLSSEMFDDSERARNFFLITPSSVFQDKTLEEVVEECRKVASDG